MAAWYPALCARKIAPKATAVFPEPTSPWISLLMAVSFCRSSAISFSTFRCACVGVKERESQYSSSAPFRSVNGAERSFLVLDRDTYIRYSSVCSKASLLLAVFRASWSSGKCAWRIA